MKRFLLVGILLLFSGFSSPVFAAGGTASESCTGAGCLLSCIETPDAPNIIGFTAYRNASATCYESDGTFSIPPSPKFYDGFNPLDAVYETGNVGVGTSVPEELLHISGDPLDLKGTKIQITDEDGAPELEFSNNDGKNWSIKNGVADTLEIVSQELATTLLEINTTGIDAKNKTIQNITAPVFPGDVANAKYADRLDPIYCVGTGKVLQFDGNNWYCVLKGTAPAICGFDTPNGFGNCTFDAPPAPPVAYDWVTYDPTTGNLSQYAWGDNTGYISVRNNADGYGLQMPANYASGDVTGKAWGDTTGFIDFGKTASGYGVTFDANRNAFSGFAWSDRIGLLRFDDPKGKYGVYLDRSTNHIVGFAWSDVAGYVQFGPLNGFTPPAPPVAYDWVIYNPTTGDLSQYAWSQKKGYISVRNNANGYGVTMNANYKSGIVTGKAWGAQTGYIDFYDFLFGDYGVTFDAASNALVGYAWSQKTGYIKMHDYNGNYGVYLDRNTNRFVGSGWSAKIGYVKFGDMGSLTFTPPARPLCTFDTRPGFGKCVFQ